MNMTQQHYWSAQLEKKATKRKSKGKVVESSSEDVEFLALQQQYKEIMSKMDDLVKVRNEQNKLEETHQG